MANRKSMSIRAAVRYLLGVHNTTNMLFDDIVSGKRRPNESWVKAIRETSMRAQIHINGTHPIYRTQNGAQFIPTGSSQELTEMITRLIFFVRPHETPEVKNERLRMYRHILAQPAIGQILRFSSIIFQRDIGIFIEDAAARDYINGANFDGLPLLEWAKSHLLRLMITDPNGQIVVTIPEKNNTPQIKYVSSECIEFSDRDILVWKEGDVLFGVDSNYYYKSSNNNIESIGHFFGAIPAVTLGGTPRNVKQKDGFISFFDSFFSGLFEMAEKVMSIATEIDYLVKGAHPTLEMVAMECSDCNGTGIVMSKCNSCDGHNSDCNECGGNAVNAKTCKTCNGRRIMSRSPGEAILMPPPRGNSTGYDMMKWYEPPVENWNALQKTLENYIDMALAAIYVKRTDQAQSALAKREDRKDELTFLSSIAERVFFVLKEILRFSCAAISAKPQNISIDGKTIAALAPIFGGVSVSPPAHYELRGVDDMLEDAKEAASLGDPLLTRLTATALIRHMNGGDPLSIKQNDVFNFLDIYGLRARKPNEISLLIATGIITTEDAAYYNSLDNLISRLITYMGQEKFLAADMDSISAKINELKAKLASNEPQ